jgi:16S rRNA (cytosine1402-N4)-methyltransferase
MSGDAHTPVLLEKVLDGLGIKEDGLYVDATFGRGGHSRAILERLGVKGRLMAIDRDPQAIAAAPKSLTEDQRFELIRGEIAQLAKIMGARGLTGQIDGLLLDLGVSSPQLDEAARGFSFLRDGPLDMRMDPDAGVSAATWLASVEEKQLRRVIKQFGEERHAARIARALITARSVTPILSTGQLAAIVASVVPAHTRRKHPATKTFQAIRIFINGEIEQLQAVLEQSLDVLKKGGRLCVISFHSLEDRLVKRFIRDAARESEQYRGMPNVPEAHRPTFKPIGRAISATSEEIAANRRARSAHLRIAERL